MLTLSTGDAFTQIATESGLLPAPVGRTAMGIGPAERLDVIIDFAGRLNQEVYLMDAYTLTPLLKFRVGEHVTDTSSIPAVLRPLPELGAPTPTRSWAQRRDGSLLILPALFTWSTSTTWTSNV